MFYNISSFCKVTSEKSGYTNVSLLTFFPGICWNINILYCCSSRLVIKCSRKRWHTKLYPIMASAIEVLGKQAMKTFNDRRLCQKNLDKLLSLINKITAEDVKLDKNVLDYVSRQSAPMCVMDIFENKDITIAIFILKHGVKMPMHDHPGMHGILKVCKYLWYYCLYEHYCTTSRIDSKLILFAVIFTPDYCQSKVDTRREYVFHWDKFFITI